MIRKYLTIFIIAFFLAVPSLVYAKVFNYGVIALTGGTDGSLDNIDGQNLIDGDRALLINQTYGTLTYILDADSAASESSPFIISPDSNAGDKRWILVDSIITTLNTFGTTDATPSVAGGRLFQTADTTGITDFDDGVTGQIITVLSKHAVTYDTATAQDASHNLDGSSNNIITADGDILVWMCEDGTTWNLVSAWDASADNRF